jgi:transcription termination/antitermination protein NusA
MSILDDLGIQHGTPSQDGVRVVTATAVSVSVDVATFEIREIDGSVREAICSKTEFYPDRQWQVGETYTMLEVSGGNRPMLTVVSNDLLVHLLASVCPEIRTGGVRIMGLVRLPGVRSKIAVASTQENLDAVAAVVGKRANRIAAVSQMLCGERLDILAWHPERERYLRNALAPSQIQRVEFSQHAAVAYAPRHQMAAAVGKGGLNSSLAGRLVGVKVEIRPAG